jgi:serine/threonine protein kinase
MTMRPAQPQQQKDAKAIFLEAIELPREQRGAFLDQHCAGDTSLRRRVELLLEADATRSDAGPLAGALVEFPQELVPVRIDTYHVSGIVGEGGMGRVFDAVHEPTGRRAAVKLIQAGIGTTRARERLRIEAESLARLSDPGIAQIYDAGVGEVAFADGTHTRSPFIAMEFVEGVSIIEYATTNQLDLNQRVRLIEQVALAVHHAHQRGVVHRDLKPSNILISPQGAPKVVDFGIARITDATAEAITVTGQVLGTVRYMSPEQASGDQQRVDTRSDVYTLGAMLFELIAHRPLLELDTGSTLAAALKVLNTTPPRLDEIVPGLPKDLVAIVHKAVERDLEHRYGSAQALADDLDRYLSGREVSARSPTTIERFARVVKRNKSLSAAIAVAVLAILVGAGVSTAMALVARREANAKAQALNETRVALNHEHVALHQAQTALDYLTELLSSATPERAGRDARVLDVAMQAVAQLKDRFKDEPMVLSGVQLALGRTLLSIGRSHEAYELINNSYKTRHQQLGDDDRGTVDAELARDEAALAIAGGAELGLNYARPAQWYAAHLGPADRQTLRANMLHAEAYSQFDQHNSAIALLRSTYDTYRDTYGPDDDETLDAAENLASLLVARHGDAVESIRLLGPVIDALDRKHGANCVQSTAARTSLALALNLSGRSDEAIGALEPILPAVTQVYGDVHPNTSLALRTLAVAYRDSQRFEQAQAMFDRAIETSRRAYGPSDGRTQTTRLRLAEMWLTQGRLDEAEKLVREVFLGELEKPVSGGNSAVMLTDRARVLLARHRPAEALRNLEAAMAAVILEVKVEPRHPARAEIAYWIGMCMLDLNRPADAEPCFRLALEIDELRLGPDAATRRAREKLELAQQTASQQRTPPASPPAISFDANSENVSLWLSRMGEFALAEKQPKLAASMFRDAARRFAGATGRNAQLAQQFRDRADQLDPPVP